MRKNYQKPLKRSEKRKIFCIVQKLTNMSETVESSENCRE